MNKKRCSYCKKLKFLYRFSPSSHTPDGHIYRCRECEYKRHLEWQRRNSGKVVRNNKAYRLKYPERIRARAHRYRAELTGNGGSYSGAEWIALKEFYDFHCLDCGRQEPVIQLTADHVIPVSKPGGTSFITNIQPLCRSCNSRKGAKTIDFRPAWN